MSEEVRETERTKYSIDIEPDDFNPIGEYKLVSSSELGLLAYEVFKSAFADFEGVIFEPGNGNIEPTYSLLFNHGKYGEDEVVGVRRSIDISKVDPDSVLARTRFRDSLGRDGDKYLITDDGKDVVEPLLTNPMFNRGKPKWNQIVTEYSDRPNGFYGYAPQTPQYTKVSYISISRLASLIFGRKNSETKDIYDYEARVIGTTSQARPGMPASDFMLMITRASTNEVNATYKKLGFSIANTNIIRG